MDLLSNHIVTTYPYCYLKCEAGKLRRGLYVVVPVIYKTAQKEPIGLLSTSSAE